MKRWFTFALVACTVGISYAFLENMDEYIKEVENDPVKHQLSLFNDYAVRCFGEARRNQSKIRMEESESACCLQDFWMQCMKAVPLIKECSSLMENQLRKFEEDLVTGIDCALVDLRTCVHKDGHDEFVSENKERSARFTSTASSNVASNLMAAIAVSMSVAFRML